MIKSLLEWLLAQFHPLILLLFAVMLILTMLLLADVAEGRMFRNKHQYGRIKYILASGIQIICNIIVCGFVLFIFYDVLLR